MYIVIVCFSIYIVLKPNKFEPNCSVSRSPSLIYNDNVSMIKCLRDTTVQKFSTDNDIIIVGDFNLPDLLWDHGMINCPIDTFVLHSPCYIMLIVSWPVVYFGFKFIAKFKINCIIESC